MTKTNTSAAARRATAPTSVSAGLVAPTLGQTTEAASRGQIRQATTVMGLVDAVAALAQGSLASALYLFDNNHAGGGGGQGTGSLTTRIAEGDVVVLVSMPLESEVFVRIDDVQIEQRFAEYVKLDCGAYPQTAVVYWTVEIVKTPPEPIPYRLMFRLGSRSEPVPAPAPSYFHPGLTQAQDAGKPLADQTAAATSPAVTPLAADAAAPEGAAQ